MPLEAYRSIDVDDARGYFDAEIQPGSAVHVVAFVAPAGEDVTAFLERRAAEVCPLGLRKSPVSEDAVGAGTIAAMTVECQDEAGEFAHGESQWTLMAANPAASIARVAHYGQAPTTVRVSGFYCARSESDTASASATEKRRVASAIVATSATCTTT